MWQPIKLVLAVLIISSCRDQKLPEKGFMIDIQPLGNIGKEKINYVYSETKKVYPNVQIRKTIPLPKSAYYLLRNRYRADSLISYLNNITPNGHVAIGLTNKDISAAKNGIQDWGVMGLGFCPGKACIVSSFRVSKNEKLMQMFKISLHELGHTQGLQHCEVKTCFMRDAEGRNPTNEEKEFCPKCKQYLISNGWKF
jgi:archaemetzincin